MMGGIILGGLILVASFYNLGVVGEQAHLQQTQSNFEELATNDIPFVCSRSTGTKRVREFNLINVRGIYASEGVSDSPVEIPQRIAESESFTGDTICLQFENQEPICFEQECGVDVTYIGEPIPGSDMYRLGENGGWNFEVTVEKVDDDIVEVDAVHVP